jgi:N-acetylglucosaminyldiphosphoundecaprenol N-acetyl-beta-D-mannosaminyltransferase
MRVDATSYAAAARQLCDWALERTSRYVCVANVHMTMETYDSPEFRRVVNNADLVTPDGMPLVWALKSLGVEDATRVYGPTLVLELCDEAARRGVSIFLYGGTEESVQAFQDFLRRRSPGLVVAGVIAPPFRPLSFDEDERDTKAIVDSGAGIVLVGLGCPKQERWMAAHTARIPATLVGVGAAFDFHSGRVRQAPGALQKLGLEWAFRLAMEPRRLWRRYVKHNPRFVALFARQWLNDRTGGARA